MRRWAVAAAIVVLTAVVGGVHLASHDAHAAAVRTVTIEDVDFTPASVAVRRGGTVRWTWRDGTVAHNVTSRGTRRFKSSTTKQSGTYSVRFRRTGTHRYVCTIHPNMRGRIVVR